MHGLEPLAPSDTAALFAPLHGELMTLLRALASADWERPTVAGSWRVRDVAAHLLDGDLRKLSGQRDRHDFRPERPLRSYSDIVDFINDLNATAVSWSRRLSPRLLVDLLAATGPQVSELIAGLDPHAPSWISVAWAGESESANWMDTGREYTERWHHQAQIRDAVGLLPPLLAARWLDPLLDFSVRALPHAYAATPARDGATLALVVEGDDRWTWSLVQGDGRWALYRGAADRPMTTVRIAPDSAWRLFYNALPPERARREVAIEGDEVLAGPLLRTRSVMV
jgi:Mycothiol maleylpyruvate isomerase N-terminal domain